MKNKFKADAAIFIDVAYLNKTGNGLSQFFSNNVLGRPLPQSDFGVFINSLAFQMGFEPGKRNIMVYLVREGREEKFTFCTPSDLAEEFHEKSYTDSMGTFIFWSLPTLGHDTSRNAALELAQYLCEEDKIPLAALVVDLNECPERSVGNLTSAKGTKFISFSMNPKDAETFPNFEHEELGHSLLNSFGITPEDLK